MYAIEASNMSGLCHAIVAENGLGDVIEVIHGRVEEVTLPVSSVDILVSEWMGFYLLHEAMLHSVIKVHTVYVIFFNLYLDTL